MFNLLNVLEVLLLPECYFLLNFSDNEYVSYLIFGNIGLLATPQVNSITKPLFQRHTETRACVATNSAQNMNKPLFLQWAKVESQRHVSYFRPVDHSLPDTQPVYRPQIQIRKVHMLFNVYTFVRK